MSDRNLITFLEKLHKELSRSSELYRRETSNIQVHDFGVVAVTLIQNTIDQIRADGISLDEEDIRYLTNITRDYYNELRAVFTTFNTDPSYITVLNSPSQFKVIISPKNRKKTKNNKLTKTDVFKSIATKKRKYQAEFYADIEDFYIANNKKMVRGAFLDITHQDSSAVSKQQVRQVSEKLASSKEAAGYKSFLESNGLELSIVKKRKSVSVSLGGAQQNRQLDGKGEAANKQKYKNILKSAIAKLDVPNLSGSDSLTDTARKDAIDISIDPFTKMKGVKVKKANTKRKKSSGKKITKKIKPRVTNAGTIAYINDIPEPKVKTKDSVINLQALIPVINASLADTIAANMGTPALNYRTGRFAGSARVTDITRTNKGFPSIGYTYMKDPYQIYESPGGSPNYATPARDPRKIIGQSIREIATGLIKQRFYTRRG